MEKSTDLRAEPFHNLLRMFFLLPILPSNDISTRYFGVCLFVVDTNNGDVVDVGVFKKFTFEFSWCDLRSR